MSGWGDSRNSEALASWKWGFSRVSSAGYPPPAMTVDQEQRSCCKPRVMMP